jgi:ATP-dependent exoDNAse (exonuclease V) beta subunit
VEIPVTHVLSTGQILSGRIDLLVETDLGCILIDHKASGHNTTQWDALAASYGGQLAAYRTAVETATGKPVIESWLLLPVAGGAVRIDTIS